MIIYSLFSPSFRNRFITRITMNQREMTYWTPDGVHPTLAGHSLIAQAWLKAVGAE